MDLFQESIDYFNNPEKWAEEFTKKSLGLAWSPDSIDLQTDKRDFKEKLSQIERIAVARSLISISQSEVSVKNFWWRLGSNIPNVLIKDAGISMAAAEVAHNIICRRCLSSFDLEKDYIEACQMPHMKDRMRQLKKYLYRFHKNEEKQFLTSLILFNFFVENISIFSHIYVIMSICKHNKMINLNRILKKILSEERLHIAFGVALVKRIKEESPHLFDENLHDLIKSEIIKAMMLEVTSISWSINGMHCEGMSLDIIKEFIKKRIDDVLEKMEISVKPWFVYDEDKSSESSWFEETFLNDSSGNSYKFTN